jgi:hypothetical protein
VFKVFKVKLGRKASQDLKGILVLRDLQGFKDLLEFKAFKD